jgi:hypothetical protein
MLLLPRFVYRDRDGLRIGNLHGITYGPFGLPSPFVIKKLALAEATSYSQDCDEH